MDKDVREMSDKLRYGVYVDIDADNFGWLNVEIDHDRYVVKGYNKRLCSTKIYSQNELEIFESIGIFSNIDRIGGIYRIFEW